MAVFKSEVETVGGDKPDESAHLDLGLPRWALVIALAVGLLIVFPVPLAPLAILGILWLIFFNGCLNAPPQAMLVFLVLLPATMLLPEGFRLLPGLNFQTFVTPMLALLAVTTRSAEDEALPNPFNAPVGWFAILVLLSAVVSFTTGTALLHSWERGWYNYTAWAQFASVKDVLFFLFLAPIAFRLLWSPRHFRMVAILIAIFGTATAVEAMVALWFGERVMQVGVFDRAIGQFYPEPNLLGSFLALLVCFFAALAFSKKVAMQHRLLAVIVLGTGGTALLYTFSRGAWLATIAGMLYVFASRGARGAVVLLVVALTLTLWVPTEVLDRIKHSFEEKQGFEQGVELEGSAQHRLDQWSALPRMWLEAPVFGHGYNSFGGVYREITGGGSARSAHSSIIKLTVETGVIGIASYLWILWTLGMGARRAALLAGDPFEESLSHGFVGVCVCLMVLDTTGNTFLHSDIMAYFWVAAGVILRRGAELAKAVSPDVETPPHGFANRSGANHAP